MDSQNDSRFRRGPNEISIFVGQPSDVHDNVGGCFGRQLTRALEDVDPELLSDCRHGAGMSVKIHKKSKEPDFYFRPDGLQSPPASKANKAGNPCPTIVLEVAYHHESKTELDEELDAWLSHATTVQIAIGIRIRKNLTGVSLLAIIKRRNGAEERLEFGTIVENPAESFQISLHDLLWGTEAGDKYAKLYIKIDLCKIRRMILKDLHAIP